MCQAFFLLHKLLSLVSASKAICIVLCTVTVYKCDCARCISNILGQYYLLQYKKIYNVLNKPKIPTSQLPHEVDSQLLGTYGNECSPTLGQHTD